MRWRLSRLRVALQRRGGWRHPGSRPLSRQSDRSGRTGRTATWLCFLSLCLLLPPACTASSGGRQLHRKHGARRPTFGATLDVVVDLGWPSHNTTPTGSLSFFFRCRYCQHRRPTATPRLKESHESGTGSEKYADRIHRSESMQQMPPHHPLVSTRINLFAITICWHLDRNCGKDKTRWGRRISAEAKSKDGDFVSRLCFHVVVHRQEELRSSRWPKRKCGSPGERGRSRWYPPAQTGKERKDTNYWGARGNQKGREEVTNWP